MRKKTSYLGIILVLLFCNYSIAQTETYSKEYHISTTIFNEHIAIPFKVRKDAPRHPGGTLAIEMTKKRKGSYQFYHILQVGYYYHKDFNQVAFITWKPKFELRFFEMISIHTILGIGYAHSFPVRKNYRLDNGSYKQKTSFGKPHAIPSIGFGAGIHLNEVIDIPLEIFGRYETFSLAPYALKGRVPITINTMLSFGIKYSL